MIDSMQIPTERQLIEVLTSDGRWQIGYFRLGQFVDLYGMSLDTKKISRWRPAEEAGRLYNVAKKTID
jgi:hypothetical protein